MDGISLCERPFVLLSHFSSIPAAISGDTMIGFRAPNGSLDLEAAPVVFCPVIWEVALVYTLFYVMMENETLKYPTTKNIVN